LKGEIMSTAVDPVDEVLPTPRLLALACSMCW
jgi:hypothetical protein